MPRSASHPGPPRLRSCAPKKYGGAPDLRHQKGGGIVPQTHRFGHPWPNIKRRVAALPARQSLPLSPPAPFPLLGKGERRVAAAKPAGQGPRCGHGRRVATARPRAYAASSAYVLTQAIAHPQNPCDLGKINESASFWSGKQLVYDSTIPVPAAVRRDQKKRPVAVITRGRPEPNPP